MNKELIMKSDVLDILFENRNKNYGAYDLRKFYANRLKRSFGIIMAIVIIFSAFTFLPKKKVYETSPYSINGPELGKLKKMEKKQPEIKPKTTIPVKKNIATGKWVSIMKIVDNKDSSDKMNIDLDKLAIGSTTNNIGDAPQTDIPEDNGNGKITEPVKPIIDKTDPMDLAAVDMPPSYPGGMDALRKFLERNLHNPRDMEEGESVSVRVKFVVDYNGKLQSFVTLVDGGEEFNKEVVRVLKKMPEWIPGKAKGENVSVYYTIPVKFVPSD